MKLFGTVLTVAFVMVLSSAGISNAASENFIGVKTGQMTVDVSGADNITPIGVIYGRSLDSVLKNLSIEGEFNYGISGGDVDTGIAGVTEEINIWTIALYGAYRYPVSDKVYLKGKLGLLYESVEAEASGFGITVSDTATDTGLSLGVGAGFDISDELAVEAEYTLIEEDIDYLSVGLHYRF